MFLFRKATHSVAIVENAKHTHRTLGGDTGTLAGLRAPAWPPRPPQQATRWTSATPGFIFVLCSFSKADWDCAGDKGGQSQSLPPGAQSTSETGANSRHKTHSQSSLAQAQCAMGPAGAAPWKRGGPRAHLDGERAQGSPRAWASPQLSSPSLRGAVCLGGAHGLNPTRGRGQPAHLSTSTVLGRAAGGSLSSPASAPLSGEGEVGGSG